MEIVQTQNNSSGKKLMGVFSRRRKVMLLAGMFALLIVTGY